MIFENIQCIPQGVFIDSSPRALKQNEELDSMR